MLKKRIFTLFSMIVFLGVSLLAGCGGPSSTGSSSSSSSTGGGSTEKYTVSYFFEDGTQYGDKLTVDAGSKLTKPADPTKESDEDYSYSFDGWYLTGATKAWDFATDTVTKNIQLFAKFNETAITYDLTVWVYGSGTNETKPDYITEQESARVEETAKELLPNKKVLVKYFDRVENDVFNTKVINASAKPDVVISGNNMTGEGTEKPLSLKENFGKTKVGLGWFNNTSRRVGILDTCEANFENAKALYNKLLTKGPDYFEFASTSLPMSLNDTSTLLPTLNDGDTRKVSYKSSDETVVTVSAEGVVTALKEGSAVISAVLGLVTVEIEVNVLPKTVNLVVYIYGSGSKTVYITEEESNALKAEYIKLTGFEENTIVWEYMTGIKAADLGEAVNGSISNGTVVDAVIGGNNIDAADGANIELLKENEVALKTKAGAGWFENTSRFLGIPSACTERLENAKKLFDLFKNISPLYEGVTLSTTEATLTVESTLPLEVTAYGEVTWSSSNKEVATVDENGVVTAVAVGNATITATAAKGSATCEITVEAKPEVAPKLVVYVYGSGPKTTYIKAEESEAVKAAFLAASGLTEDEIIWKIIDGVKVAPFGEEVNASITAGTPVDVVIAGGNVETSGGVTLAKDGDATLMVAAGTGWFADDARKVAITAACNANLETAKILYDLLAAAKA